MAAQWRREIFKTLPSRNHIWLLTLSSPCKASFLKLKECDRRVFFVQNLTQLSVLLFLNWIFKIFLIGSLLMASQIISVNNLMINWDFWNAQYENISTAIDLNISLKEVFKAKFSCNPVIANEMALVLIISEGSVLSPVLVGPKHPVYAEWV